MSDYPQISSNPEIQAEYEEMRRSGTSHSIAEICATQTCPSLQTDTRFMSGRSESTYYSRQLQANIGSRADVERISKEKGWGCEGSVSVKKAPDNRPRADEVPYNVAPDILANAVLDITDEHPTALQDDPDLIRKTKKRLEGDWGSS